jgi:hypothetical protein
MRVYADVRWGRHAFGGDVDGLAGDGGRADRLAGLRLVLVDLGGVDVADAGLQREGAGLDGGLLRVARPVAPGEPGDGGAVEEGERGGGLDGHGTGWDWDWEVVGMGKEAREAGRSVTYRVLKSDGHVGVVVCMASSQQIDKGGILCCARATPFWCDARVLTAMLLT